jgi:hypothetical protein
MTYEEADAEWAEYKSAWLGGVPRQMPSELFSELFINGNRSREAVDLAKSSPVARDALREASLGVPIHDGDVRRVWLAVTDDQTVETIETLFGTHREQLTPGDRQRFIESILSHLGHDRGRGFIRSTFRKWWALPLLEEEREALIRAAVTCGIRDQAFYRVLGPVALDLARREIWKHGWDGGWGPAQSFGPLSPEGLPGLSSRFDVLLEHVELATDLRDACLTPSELVQLGTWPTQMGPPWSAFRRGLKQMFGHPAFEEFIHAVGRHAFLRPGPSGTHGPCWSFPVLRFLHLQQILEAPRLSRTVRDPALVLVPDVALYVMGRDDVVFQPELRLLRGADRRWRARWAETAGEAVSVMFLEDSVELDLGTLSRVPERTDRPTPDFMAGTLPGQNVVFESKGATNWRTHLKQRRYALEQLGKKPSANGDLSWGSKGRAFACSLFAAEQGEDRTSLLHVDDPPFQFEQDFGEGWDLRSRRDHAIAMLEAARLYELADDLARRRRTERVQREVATFRLPGAEGQEEGVTFLGSYLPVGEWARSLRHPSPRECARIQMFVGVEQGLYRSFEHERFPSFLAPSVDSTAGRKIEVSGVPVTGMLPGEVTGVYSVLGDGAFLAVLFE